jgi:oligoribonuclease (3'-5' exoribonuclease)
MALLYAGVDGEMTGPNPGRHRLFEIGVALEGGECFHRRIGWDEFEYDPEALAAIGVEPSAVQEGPPAAVVDEELTGWLRAHGAEDSSIVAVGWAVERFDLPFVRRTLPSASRLLRWQAVDLGGICHTLAGALEAALGPEDWKARAKQAAEDALASAGRPPAWHDAGYDALASLASWHWLRACLRGGEP